MEKNLIEKELVDDLKKLIEKAKPVFFKHPERATDEETLGILISKYSMWDVNFIFDVSKRAFEDSNYHSFNEKFEALWNQEE